MTTEFTRRCFDCFHLFKADEDRFAVLKKMRDMPEGWHGTDQALNLLEGLMFDQVFVCGECAGWYGDDAIQLSAEDATA